TGHASSDQPLRAMRRNANAATAASNIVPTISAHGVRAGAGAGADATVHIPSCPGRSQRSSGSSHGVSQHTSSTQNVEVHCVPLLPSAPLGCRVGVCVAVAVVLGDAVGELVRVVVGVLLGVLVAVLVGVWVGVRVGVLVGVIVGVDVDVCVDVIVAVAVAVLV